MPDARYVGAGIGAGALLAGRQAVNNEANFVDVAKTLDFAGGNTGKEAQAMRNQLNQLAVQMAGVNEADVMRIAAGGATGGIAKEDLLAYTRDTIMTATAWDMSAEAAAEKGMALRNSLGYQEGEAGRQQFLVMSNMINDVANKNGGVKARDLLGVMSRTGALMTNSGFSEQGALGLAGALLSKGASEEEAATASKNIASRLTAGFSATGAQQEIFAMLGTDALSVADGMQTDAMGTLMDVLNGISGLDATEQAAAIKELFGDEAAAHVQKLIKDTTKLKKIQSDAQKASMSSVEDEYNGIAATNKAKLEEAGQALNHLGIAIGDKLLPVIDPVVGLVADGAMAAAEFINQGGIAVDVLLGLGAAAATGFAAYKAYQGFKAVRNLAGIAKESMALASASRATEKHTQALERQARASDRAARATRRGGVSSGSLGASGGRRRRRRGKAGLIAGALGLGASMFAMPSFAAGDVGMAADAVGAASDMADGIPLDKAAKMAKFIKPLALGIDAVSIGSSLMSGDTDAALETGGGVLGGIGGAALGATIGTMILPGIGTAIGGALGGIGGDAGGEWIASKVMGWFSSDTLPDKSKEIQAAQIKEAQAKQMPPLTFSPQIQISDVSDPKEAAALAMDQMQDLFRQFLQENGMDAGELTQDINHSLGA
nr:phage tail tape measure protein [Vibrio brasiliensis]